MDACRSPTYLLTNCASFALGGHSRIIRTCQQDALLPHITIPYFNACSPLYGDESPIDELTPAITEGKASEIAPYLRFIGRRFTQIFAVADKIKKAAFISVHLRPKEYVSTLCLGMAEQLPAGEIEWGVRVEGLHGQQMIVAAARATPR